MPYTRKQLRLFRAAAHNPDIARKHGLDQAEAADMAKEGVKPEHRRRGRSRKRTILHGE